MTTLTAKLIKTLTPIVRREVGRLLCRIEGDVPVADLTSAAWEAIIDLMRRHPGLKGAELASMITIRVRGAIRDELRRYNWGRQRLRPGQRAWQRVELPEQMEPSAPSVTEALEARYDLSVLMAGLDARDRQCLTALMRETPLCALAAQMGLSEPRVSQLTSRAIARARERLRHACLRRIQGLCPGASCADYDRTLCALRSEKGPDEPG